MNARSFDSVENDFLPHAMRYSSSKETGEKPFHGLFFFVQIKFHAVRLFVPCNFLLKTGVPFPSCLPFNARVRDKTAEPRNALSGPSETQSFTNDKQETSFNRGRRKKKKDEASRKRKQSTTRRKRNDKHFQRSINERRNSIDSNDE